MVEEIIKGLSINLPQIKKMNTGFEDAIKKLETTPIDEIIEEPKKLIKLITIL